MKKYILFFAILFATNLKAQSIDTVKSAIQVNPVVVNAILKDTAFQVTVSVFGITLGDSTKGANTYVQVFDRKAKKLFDKNVEIPSDVVNLWGTDDTIIINFVLNYLSLTKK